MLKFVRTKAELSLCNLVPPEDVWKGGRGLDVAICTSTEYGYSLYKEPVLLYVRDIRREIRSDFACFSFRIKKQKLGEKDGTEWLRPCLKSWASVGDVID